MIRFDTSSPECGWAPFVEWMRSQGIDPTDVYALDVDTSGMTATVRTFARHRRFRRPIRTGPRSVSISSLPPLRREQAS